MKPAFLFEIRHLSFFTNQKNEEIDPCCHHILWIKKGSGELVSSGRHFPICENMVYCLHPSRLNYFKPENQAEGYIITVSTDFYFDIHSAFPNFCLPGNKSHILPLSIRMDIDLQHDTEAILQKLRKEFENYFSLRTEILSRLFSIFLLYLERKFSEENQMLNNTRNKELTRAFTGLLRKYFTTKKLVADYANELNVTPDNLNRIVKKVSGFTASYHIQQYIVSEAKKQARIWNRTMKEIAYDLGFDDIAHFSKYFKSNSGVNFTNFKKSLTESIRTCSS